MGTSAFEERLDQLLDETIPHAVTRAHTSYDFIARDSANSMVLFGAGRFGRLVNRKLRDLQIPPIAFTDNNPSLWGKQVDDTDVISPRDAASLYGDRAVFIVCIWNGEATDRMADRIRQLALVGCRIVISFGSLFWKYDKTFLPHYCLDLPEKVLGQKTLIKAAMRLWSDEYSKEEFLSQVGFRTSMDFDLISRREDGRHYFPHNLFRLNEEEIFVDCGAFDGDTISDFVQESHERFRHVVAFEPDAITFPKLHKRVQQLPGGINSRITLNQTAVGRKTGLIGFDATGTMLSTTGAGASLVSVVDLDSALASLDPTFIKFDVEGFELDALVGASGVLSRNRPILAVSAYHEQSHLWRIPLLLSSLVQENYRFFLRPHGSESWDLVCYAIPEERVSYSRAFEESL